MCNKIAKVSFDHFDCLLLPLRIMSNLPSYLNVCVCVCVCVSICLVMSSSLQPHGLYLPGSSVHEISQARILEQIAISFSRRSSQPRDQTLVSCISCMADGFFITTQPGKP